MTTIKTWFQVKFAQVMLWFTSKSLDFEYDRMIYLRAVIQHDEQREVYWAKRILELRGK